MAAVNLTEFNLDEATLYWFVKEKERAAKVVQYAFLPDELSVALAKFAFRRGKDRAERDSLSKEDQTAVSLATLNLVADFLHSDEACQLRMYGNG